MTNSNLWAGALSLILIYEETGCPHSARHAIRLLECLCDLEEIDPETRQLCERASNRLGRPSVLTNPHHNPNCLP